MDTVALLVRTLRGLEHIAAAEVRDRFGVARPVLGHREVRFALPHLAPELVELGTVDDAFLVVSDDAPLGRQRRELERLRRLGRTLDLDATARLLSGVRPLEAGMFDVTGSFLGRRNFSRYELEDAVADGVTDASDWIRDLRHGAGLSLRVHLTRERTTIAARVAAAPLHRRAYRIASTAGSLHPPLARALALLATPTGGGVLVDPFCGAGTIAIEAMLASSRLAATGSDIDPAAIAAARANAAAAGVAASFVRADAASIAFADGAVDAVAANPPWERRVAARGRLRRGLEPFWRELERVLRPGGRVALVGVYQGPPRPCVLTLEQRFPVRVSGAWVEVTVLRRAF